ncbi:MAG: hypothetical protein JO287_15560, partial [Pseudonocardiales bacterium]|nr:hypothetical protein [Pseudonocardiales bacterium]
SLPGDQGWGKGDHREVDHEKPQRENGQEHVRVLGGKRVAGELGLAEMIALSASEAIQSSGDGVTRRTNLGVPAG